VRRIYTAGLLKSVDAGLPTVLRPRPDHPWEGAVERVIRQATRLFRMSPERRAHCVSVAKSELARSARDTDSPGTIAASKQAAAILLSQGIATI
jgi:hypothetical protein